MIIDKKNYVVTGIELSVTPRYDYTFCITKDLEYFSNERNIDLNVETVEKPIQTYKFLKPNGEIDILNVAWSPDVERFIGMPLKYQQELSDENKRLVEENKKIKNSSLIEDLEDEIKIISRVNNNFKKELRNFRYLRFIDRLKFLFLGEKYFRGGNYEENEDII